MKDLTWTPKAQDNPGRPFWLVIELWRDHRLIDTCLLNDKLSVKEIRQYLGLKGHQKIVYYPEDRPDLATPLPLAD